MDNDSKAKPEVRLTPIVRAIDRRWQEAVDDESYTDVAFTFDLVMKDAGTAESRAILDWWWDAGPSVRAITASAPHALGDLGSN